jgi:hypothetical protein
MEGVVSQVKHRLDYQMEKSNLERRLAQKHMVDWIVRNVTKVPFFFFLPLSH